MGVVLVRGVQEEGVIACVKHFAFNSDEKCPVQSIYNLRSKNRKRSISPTFSVVQLYIGYGNSKMDRPVKQLCGFEREVMKPGESKEIAIRCPLEKLNITILSQESGYLSICSIRFLLVLPVRTGIC